MSERAMRQAPADMTAWDYALRGLWPSGGRPTTMVSRPLRCSPAPSSWTCFRLRPRAPRPRPLPDAPAALDHRSRGGPRRARRARGARCHLRPDGGERLPLPGARVFGARPARRRDHRSAPGGRAEPEPSGRALAPRAVPRNRGPNRGGASRTRQCDPPEPSRPATLDVPRRQTNRPLHCGQVRGIAGGERASTRDRPRCRGATAYSNIAATSAHLGDLPRARAALAETLRVWPNMSEATLRALFASIPEGHVEKFFHGLRVAGWTPDEERAPAVRQQRAERWTRSTAIFVCVRGRGAPGIGGRHAARPRATTANGMSARCSFRFRERRAQ